LSLLQLAQAATWLAFVSLPPRLTGMK